MSELPKGWVETTLGKVATISSSKRIFHADYVQSGIPFYRSKEIIEKQKGNKISSELFITEEKFNAIRIKYGSPEKTDLLLTSVGTLGIPYLVQENEVFYFKDGNLTWFRDYKNIEPLLLYYFFLSSIGKERLNEITIGSTQSALTIIGLKTIPINLPLLPEQKAIAGVLSVFDEKIELLREQNETLETIAQTIFKEWFVNFNYPGATGEMVDSELGEIPKGWRVGTLEDEFDITIGRTPPRKERHWFSKTPTGKKWTSIKDMVKSGVYIYDTSEYITDEGIEKFNIPIIPKNTVILSFKMTVGKLSITTEDMISNEAIAHMKIKNGSEMISEYIYLFLHDLDFNSLGSTSSIVTAINSTMIKQILFLIPDSNMLQNFDKLISPIFKKIKNNTAQIQTLSKTRDTLLPKLMNGEVRTAGFEQ